MHERKTVREKGWMVGEKEEEGERNWRTTPRTTAPLESTPTFSRDSIGAFGWLSLVKVRERKQFIRRLG